ncbi:NTF2 fold immunity protein [Armatimonas rosea]|uniref:NTF2 fold immunity protein domain-containing protein n=1 Tax=Armatimonas rosea TaxID=685828 RepID=A0A7W9W9F4_ARMRO|nr:NTF2 fold immunity protein [Armatimonas rosea]MBB6053145.1 hypothetical protein [Armatimonas rosea]
MNPEDVLKEFIIAMNAWETSTWQAYQEAKDNGDQIAYAIFEDSKEPLKTIFEKYCTRRDRPYGRYSENSLPSFSHPSDYDPENEHIVEVIYASPRRVIISTHKPNKALPSARTVTEYVLLKKAGEWRVDNKKILYDDGTKLPYFL